MLLFTFNFLKICKLLPIDGIIIAYTNTKNFTYFPVMLSRLTSLPMHVCACVLCAFDG